MTDTYQFSKNYPPIPLFSRVKKEDFTYIKVFHEWTDEQGNMKRTNYQLPVIDSNEPEHLLFCISMFEEHCSGDLLNLEKGSTKFAKFLTILRGENRDIWRDVIDNTVQMTNKNFKSTISEFIGRFLSKGDIKIQREYFLTKCFKGRSQTVKDVDQRIRTICRYCDRFPTAKKNYFDDEDIKHFIYQAMPTGLQQVFDQSGKSWFDESISRSEMVNFFHNVHTAYQHKQETKRKAQNQVNQRSNKRFQNNNQDRQYQEFLQWQRMRNQRFSNSNNNNNHTNYQASRNSNQRTFNTNNRNQTPMQTRHQARQQQQQRSNSSTRNNSNTNNRTTPRNTRSTARRLFNNNDQYFNDDNDEQQYDDQINEYDQTNDQYFEDSPQEFYENSQDPDKYINDDSFQQQQGNNDNDMYFNEFFNGEYE